MSIISVNNLSKRYRIGRKGRGWDSGLRHALTDLVTRPFRRGKAAEEDETEFWALKDVSFEVEEGEVLGIIGRNGAGKSTLLKILSRITWPTEGEVRIRGRVASLLEVGTGFHPELTGRENIYLNGSILGMSRAEVKSKFDEIVAFSEIEKFLDTPVKRYSSGMYVRLAFAVAAHLDPEILLVDEVLAVGDAGFQKKCLGKMGEVAKHGRTVLFVSHNMAAVKSLCLGVIWLDKGQVECAGKSPIVTAKYLSDSMKSEGSVWTATTETVSDRRDVYMESAKAVNGSANGEKHFDITTPIKLVFEVRNKLDQAALAFAVHLYTDEEICVMASKSKEQPYPAGLIRAACCIPRNLLNDGCYNVTFRVVKDTYTLYRHERVLNIMIQDIARPFGSKLGKWPGVVRPNLSWTTEAAQR